MKLLFPFLLKATLPVVAAALSTSLTNNFQTPRKQFLLGTWSASTECLQATLIFNNQTASLHSKGAGKDVTYAFNYHLASSGAIKFWGKSGKPSFHLVQTLTQTKLAIRPYSVSSHSKEFIDLTDELTFTKQP